MTLRQRILFGYAIPIVITFIVAGLAYYAGERSIRTSADLDHEDSLVALRSVVLQSLLNTETGFRGYIITGKDNFLEPLVKGRKDFITATETIRQLLAAENERSELWEAVGDLAIHHLIPWQDSVLRLRRVGTDSAIQTTRAMIASGAEKAYMDSARGILETLRKSHDSEMVGSRDKESHAMDSIAEIVFIGAGAGAVVAIIAALMISAGIVRRVDEAVNAITTSSAQIAATVSEHERTATHQAAAVNETTSTMDELAASSRRSSEQADVISAAARQSLALTEGGTATVQQTLDSMEMLKDRVGSIAEHILRLSEHTNQIGAITNLVSDLANQTNLLALNAAVEAARAGEHGKGFAVVAVEIRKLADLSKKSAERINNLVADIQKSTNSTVMATEEGTKTVEEGIRLSHRTGDAFETSAISLSGTFESVQQITLNMRQQAAAIKQVVEAMSSINAGARENSAGVTQTKAGVQILVEAAQKLRALVG